MRCDEVSLVRSGEAYLTVPHRAPVRYLTITKTELNLGKAASGVLALTLDKAATEALMRSGEVFRRTNIARCLHYLAKIMHRITNLHPVVDVEETIQFHLV